MHDVVKRLNRVASKFEHTRITQVDDLRRVAAIAGECGSEYEALRMALIQFIAMGEQEWINAKSMKTTKAKMYCVHRSRTWYDAAEWIKRRMEHSNVKTD